MIDAERKPEIVSNDIPKSPAKQVRRQEAGKITKLFDRQRNTRVLSREEEHQVAVNLRDARVSFATLVSRAPDGAA